MRVGGLVGSLDHAEEHVGTLWEAYSVIRTSASPGSLEDGKSSGYTLTCFVSRRRFTARHLNLSPIMLTLLSLHRVRPVHPHRNHLRGGLLRRVPPHSPLHPFLPVIHPSPALVATQPHG